MNDFLTFLFHLLLNPIGFIGALIMIICMIYLFIQQRKDIEHFYDIEAKKLRKGKKD